MRDRLSLLVGITALVLAGLALASQAGVDHIDPAVTVVSVWTGLAAVGLTRSLISLQRRFRPGPPASG